MIIDAEWVPDRKNILDRFKVLSAKVVTTAYLSRVAPSVLKDEESGNPSRYKHQGEELFILRSAIRGAERGQVPFQTLAYSGIDPTGVRKNRRDPAWYQSLRDKCELPPLELSDWCVPFRLSPSRQYFSAI